MMRLTDAVDKESETVINQSRLLWHVVHDMTANLLRVCLCVGLPKRIKLFLYDAYHRQQLAYFLLRGVRIYPRKGRPPPPQ